MPRFFGPLSITGDGSDENAYSPDVPKGVAGRIDDYVDWGAWYYPQNPPYQYCLITVYKVKKALPTAVNKLELTLADCQSKYPDFYKSLETSKQNVADPSPESWNFDSDAVGQMPAGWTLDAGTMNVQNDQYVSSPNSFKANPNNNMTGEFVAHAGASRTDLMVKAQTRVVTGDNWAMLLFRFVDFNNWYGLAYNQQTNLLRLRKRVAGAITNIAYASYTFNGATWYELKVEMQGQNARGYVNDVQVVPASGWQDMGSDFASGVIGVRSYCTLTTQNQWFDDVYVEDYGAAPTYINVSDVGSGVDTPILEGQISIAELGTGVDLPGLEGQISVSEAGAGTDMLLNIELPISDLGSGAEAITLNVQVPISDLGSAAELIDLLTQIQIIDSGTGSESVTAGPPAAIKTKIFLIFGDLAIQLTGD